MYFIIHHQLNSENRRNTNQVKTAQQASPHFSLFIYWYDLFIITIYYNLLSDVTLCSTCHPLIASSSSESPLWCQIFAECISSVTQMLKRICYVRITYLTYFPNYKLSSIQVCSCSDDMSPLSNVYCIMNPWSRVQRVRRFQRVQNAKMARKVQSPVWKYETDVKPKKIWSSDPVHERS